MALETEIEINFRAFQEKLPELLRDKTNIGKFAVGRKSDGFDCWTSWEDALKIGYKRYGLQNFIVHEVKELDFSKTFTRAINYFSSS